MTSLILGAAGLNVVTKGKMSAFGFGLGFSDALLLWNLLSASIFFLVVSE